MDCASLRAGRPDYGHCASGIRARQTQYSPCSGGATNGRGGTFKDLELAIANNCDRQG
jgi:hypothetical protein